MSFTASVRPEAKSRIPAVTHVDGTSRLQLLRRSDNPLYYHLIRRFRDLTGLPLVLNTSFNIEGEPIVETPDDAVWSFLRAEIDCLVMGPWLVGKRPFPQEDDLPSLIVRSSPDLMIETVYHASGALNSATLYLRGRGEECGELGLAILEQCAEPARAADVLRSVAGEGVFRPQDTVAELRRLYERCIVIFEPTDA
jgi:hypothetical protein